MLDTNPMLTVARRPLLPTALTQAAPAAFAQAPDSTRTSRHYQFISTARVIDALLEAGFEPTRAQQTRSRAGSSANHAKHMIRFSFIKNELSLLDAVPELILINSHDATSAYIMLNLACHHRRDSTCYPAYLQLNPRRGTMVTFSEELTVRNGEAGAPEHLILRHRCRRQGAPLLTRCAHCGRPAATALMLLMPEPVNAWI